MLKIIDTKLIIKELQPNTLNKKCPVNQSHQDIFVILKPDYSASATLATFSFLSNFFFASSRAESSI